jgi:hypothetical protein
MHQFRGIPEKRGMPRACTAGDLSVVHVLRVERAVDPCRLERGQRVRQLAAIAAQLEVFLERARTSTTERPRQESR